MTNEQLYLAMGVPAAVSAVLLAILFASINARDNGLQSKLDALNQRFDDLRDLWRAELRRFEETIGARLEHLEESR
jgi:hypothetical protein